MSKPLRELADVYYGKSPNEVVSDESVIPIIGTGGVYGRATRAMYQGPAVVVPRKGSLGNPQFIGEPFWPADTTYAVLPKPKVDAKWLYYSLAAFDLTKLNEATGVPSINRDWLYRIKLGSDEFDGQCRIAEILSTVDEAIEQTEALIAKYQQIKAGLMHDLFTRGVNPDGHLRPTRAEAPHLYKESPLGWIPKEWQLRSCSDVSVSVIDCKNRTPPVTLEGHPVIRTPNVRDGEFVWGDLNYTDEKSYLTWTARGKPQSGDIVITREAPVGEVCMIPADLDAPCLGQRMMLYRPDPDQIFPTFMLHALQSLRVQKYLDTISGGSTVGHVKVGEIRSLKIPYPGLPEQQIIVDTLQVSRCHLGAAVRAVSILRQQKQGLMHDLLTGRVRVKVADPVTR